ncbi:MAG TPA: glycosyltransferase family 39 protein [Anaeromyxobacter sp.]|nr:glycosyltransferase family 39 protein [Anaeromyxobacter sp.]
MIGRERGPASRAELGGPAAEPGAPPRERRLRWGVAAALVAGCAVLHAGAVRGEFVIDDRTFFVENDVLPRLGPADALTVFTRPTNDWGDFQPVRDLLFVLQHSAFGRDPAGYHVVSIALYAVACLLAFALARALLGAGRGGAEPDASTAAAVAAALFAIHPAHVEAVAYICGQKELLGGLFSLASLLAFHSAFERPDRRASRVAAGLVLYGLGILSKQTAVVLAAAVPLLWLLSDRARRPAPLRSAAVWAIANVPAVLWMIRSREAFQALWGSTSALASVPALDRIPLAIRILGAHARLAVWPHPLSFGYPFDERTALDGHLAAGLVALAIAAGLVWRYRREPAVVFGAASFFLFLVPVMQLHGSLNNASVYDRYLFLPVFGLALVVERLARELLLARLRAPRAWAAALGAVAVAGAVLTVRHVPAFADDVAVSRTSYEAFPGWTRPPFELAYTLVERGRIAEARALVAREPSLDAPPWVRPYLEGWMILAEGRPHEAIPVLGRASFLAVTGGYYPFPSIPLARALAQAGRLEEAEAEARRALASPIYQPLEAYHAREVLAAIERRRAEAR